MSLSLYRFCLAMSRFATRLLLGTTCDSWQFSSCCCRWLSADHRAGMVATWYTLTEGVEERHDLCPSVPVVKSLLNPLHAGQHVVFTVTVLLQHRFYLLSKQTPFLHCCTAPMCRIHNVTGFSCWWMACIWYQFLCTLCCCGRLCCWHVHTL